MKNHFMAAALILALVTAMAGCSSGKEMNKGKATAPNTPAPVTLKVMLFGDRPTGLDKVLEEFEKQTKVTLNTKLDIEWVPLADYMQKEKLKMTEGEKVDLVFDAAWGNLLTLVPQGAYIELDKYFNNDAYPGLKKSFSKELLDSNRIKGKIFAVPFVQYFGQAAEGIYIRKDLREKYGLPQIKSYDDLEAFFKKVQEKEKGMVPLTVDAGRGFYNMFKPVFGKDDPLTDVTGAAVHWNVVLTKDYKKVLGAVTLGDSPEQFGKLPEPYNNPDTLYSFYKKYAEWNKYLEKDSISQKDRNGLFATGKAAAVEGDSAGFGVISTKLKAGVPNGQLEFFAYNPCFHDFKAKCLGTNYVSNNSVAIPKTSEHPDRVMKFLDWLYQSQENHDLFELGVKGVHWEEVGKNQYKPIGNHVFSAYELTWNPNYIRTNVELDENTKKYDNYLANPDTYYRRPLAGFKFDTAPVKSEIAKVQPKYGEFYRVVKHGLITDNIYEKAQKANKEWQALGLEKIRKEVIKQLQAYIDAGGN